MIRAALLAILLTLACQPVVAGPKADALRVRAESLEIRNAEAASLEIRQAQIAALTASNRTEECKAAIHMEWQARDAFRDYLGTIVGEEAMYRIYSDSLLDRVAADLDGLRIASMAAQHDPVLVALASATTHFHAQVENLPDCVPPLPWEDNGTSSLSIEGETP